MAEPQELLQFLLEQYQKQDMGEPGQEAREAALDELDQKLNTHEERMAAREGIKHFLEFGRAFLLEHPPQTHVMLAQGFGVQLAGGYEVCLVPPTIDDLGGTMEESPAYPVTEGRSIRGQGGVQSTQAVGVTGTQPEPSLRNPGG